jgi:hypothetical protein
MNSTIGSNPCQLCGIERIVDKVWTDPGETPAGGSPIKHTSMVCPDKACQAKLEQRLAREQAQRDERARIKDELAQARMNKSVPAN